LLRKALTAAREARLSREPLGLLRDRVHFRRNLRRIDADRREFFADLGIRGSEAAKTVTVQGTVTEFEWVNPHSWVRVMVNDGKTGKPVLWTLELSSPSLLNTMGLQANSLKPGDVVSVTFHPMKDGSRRGQALRVAAKSGQP
jgi:hypothetical protein